MQVLPILIELLELGRAVEPWQLVRHHLEDLIADSSNPICTFGKPFTKCCTGLPAHADGAIGREEPVDEVDSGAFLALEHESSQRVLEILEGVAIALESLVTDVAEEFHEVPQAVQLLVCHAPTIRLTPNAP